MRNSYAALKGFCCLAKDGAKYHEELWYFVSIRSKIMFDAPPHASKRLKHRVFLTHAFFSTEIKEGGGIPGVKTLGNIRECVSCWILMEFGLWLVSYG